MFVGFVLLNRHGSILVTEEFCRLLVIPIVIGLRFSTWELVGLLSRREGMGYMLTHGRVCLNNQENENLAGM